MKKPTQYPGKVAHQLRRIQYHVVKAQRGISPTRFKPILNIISRLISIIEYGHFDKMLNNKLKTERKMKRDNEKLYLKAKAEYYKGTPIMTDKAFDELENLLIIAGSDVHQTVGFKDDNRNAKFKHPSPMLSLSKYQADGYDSHVGFLDVVMKWLNIPSAKMYEATAKFDGNAVNLIYKNQRLVAGLTRGNGTHGRDITSKVIGNYTVPEKITLSAHITEIRCEIVFPIDKFEEINQDRINQGEEPYSNERNFVAGLLNNDDAPLIYLQELVFMAVAGFSYNNGIREYINLEKIENLNFNTTHPLVRPQFQPHQFDDIYKIMEEYRLQSNFRLDGIVLSVVSNDVKRQLGENKHDPNWAKAIKFPAATAKTIIQKIEWNLARDGEMIPVAVMAPILLDGSVVSRATMVNYGYVVENKYYPGAIVEIRKAGDIIPQIVNLVTATSEPPIMPHRCPSCNNLLDLQGIHLMCTYTECKAKNLNKFIHAVGVLDIFGVGESQLEKIFNSGITNVFDLLDPEKFNKENLIYTGHFKAGKALDNIFSELKKITSITLVQIFRMLEIENLGRSISKQLANEYAGLNVDYSGLDRAVIQLGRESFQQVSNIVKDIRKANIIVKFPKQEKAVLATTVKVEFTGSPKSFGYKTKAEFLNAANKLGDVRQTKLAEADYLIADNIEGTSSKIKTAHKKGIKVISYPDLLDVLSK